MNGMKIGIFGGCFNPPHKMHKSIADNLLSRGFIDKVIYVPTGDDYDKRDLAPFDDRFAMLEELFKNDERVIVSEVGNSDHGKYTYRVMNHFKEIFPEAELYFICGVDNLEEFDTWKNYEYVLANFGILVVGRGTKNVEDVILKYRAFFDHITHVEMELDDTSSTSIRNMCRKKKYDEVRKYVDEEVLSYIVKNNLYKEVV